ncbi:MAG: type II toxin-antitoxin system Phd/YefM family antitoxin [Pirellulales bacterium]|nr:type II toxin-antitoxin system Phd/YefM family antitoxin [Pirellulales bacterium]
MIRISAEALQNDWQTYLTRIQAGETVVVFLDDTAVAEIKPIEVVESSLRPAGLCAGEFVVPDDFDASLPPEILQSFEGR